MGDFFLTSMSDVSCPVLLHPEWEFSGGLQMNRTIQRTLSGNLYSFTWGNFYKFSLPLRFVNSNDQSLFSGWWAESQDVALTLDSSHTPSTLVCRIVNESEPMPRFEAHDKNLYQGELQLESISNTQPSGRPFILDDDISGLLDQPYNALIG